MNEEQNIGDQSTDDTPQSAEDSSQPPTDPQVQTTNYQLQTANMEVHKHPHHVTHKKKWTEYLLEFFMLFLAVFLGFVAENIREHGVERAREKEYMRSMLKDLAADRINLTKIIDNKTDKITLADSLFSFFESRQYIENAANIYFVGRRLMFLDFFTTTDGTLQQLKNAGGFRLIHKQPVIDSIQSYSYTYSNLKDLQDLEKAQVTDYRNAASKIFDVFIFEKMVSGWDVVKPEGTPKLISYDKKDINEMLLKVHTTKVNRLYHIKMYHDLDAKAKNLMQLIKKEYHLDNE